VDYDDHYFNENVYQEDYESVGDNKKENLKENVFSF